MFTKYENGAEVDISEVYRYDKEAGVEVAAEGVYKYNAADGVEEQVWGASEITIGRMQTKDETLTNYHVELISDGKGWGVFRDTAGSAYGRVTFYIEGEFVNPTISLDYWGEYTYYNEDGELKTAAIGSILLYRKTSDGQGNAVGSIISNMSSSNMGDGTYSVTLDGTFNYIGVEFIFMGISDSVTYPDQWIGISNMYIDDMLCLPDKQYLS